MDQWNGWTYNCQDGDPFHGGGVVPVNETETVILVVTETY